MPTSSMISGRVGATLNMRPPDDFLKTLAAHCGAGLIREQTHPYLPLAIYNYTPQVQYSKAWDEVTLTCRGLILNTETQEIVARPFPKFFNWSEWDPDKQAEYLNLSRTHGFYAAQPAYHILDKVDGSLGIMFYWDGEWMLATRGSFNSEQAQRGQKLLVNYDLSAIPTEGVTPLVEIIYPENRVVVDYGDQEALVLLGALSIPTGNRLPTPWWTGPRVSPQFHTIEEALADQRDNKEGFVIVFVDGEMAKIKHEEYVRLHRILTGTNAVRVWEALQDETLRSKVMDRVPDEFLDWFRSVELDLLTQYARIEIAAREDYMANEHLALISRKAFAEFATTTEHADILFAMLDGKDYAPRIWRRIKPEATRPFKEEV